MASNVCHLKITRCQALKMTSKAKYSYLTIEFKLMRNPLQSSRKKLQSTIDGTKVLCTVTQTKQWGGQSLSDNVRPASCSINGAAKSAVSNFQWIRLAVASPPSPPGPPSTPTSTTQPPPAPIVCTLLPLYSPLLSPPLVTIHNDYFAHRARGLPFQKMSHRFLDSTNKLKSRSTCMQCTDKLQTDNLIIENCNSN